MIMCRELSEDEIKLIARSCRDYGGFVDELRFAKELFEAARIQQTHERANNANSNQT